VDIVVIVQAETELFQVVFALRPAGRLPGLLHRRQQQGNQNRDDGNHHQQFNQGKSAFRESEHRSSLQKEEWSRQ